MKTINKYPLCREGGGLDAYRILAPADSQLLSVQMQGDVLMAWVFCSNSTINIPFEFQIFGTGFDVTDKTCQIFAGTVQAGRFVWHVFTDMGKHP